MKLRRIQFLVFLNTHLNTKHVDTKKDKRVGPQVLATLVTPFPLYPYNHQDFPKKNVWKISTPGQFN